MKQRSLEQLNRPDPEKFKQMDKMPVRVVLDNMRSGLNVGAIFRTCDAFAVEAIHLCGITAIPPHAEILKTALGATESVSWQHDKETIEVLEKLIKEGYQLWPVEQTDQSVMLEDFILPADIHIALIFGNEVKGLSSEVLALCERSIEIPQSGTKHSLNVATTAGIVLWECYRQNRRRRLSPEL